MTNFETAVAAVKTATTVQHWNELRDGVKHTLTQVELYKVDTSGLIVKVLGQDVKI